MSSIETRLKRLAANETVLCPTCNTRVRRETIKAQDAQAHGQGLGYDWGKLSDAEFAVFVSLHHKACADTADSHIPQTPLAELMRELQAALIELEAKSRAESNGDQSR